MTDDPKRFKLRTGIGESFVYGYNTKHPLIGRDEVVESPGGMSAYGGPFIMTRDGKRDISVGKRVVIREDGKAEIMRDEIFDALYEPIP